MFSWISVRIFLLLIINLVIKGVLLPHATVLNRLQWQWQELPYAEDEEHCIFKTSLTFVDSVCEIWGPLLQGRTLVVVPKHITRDPERFISVLEKHKVGTLVLQIKLLKRNEIHKEESLKIKKKEAIQICFK